MENYNKILGCLTGIAIGDALGMPTEFMTPKRINQTYGYINDFNVPSSDHIHPDMKKGEITDDTGQTLALVEEILRRKEINIQVAATGLINWANDKDVFNSTFLGPSSKKALQKLINGNNPKETGKSGTTVGAAMRAPVAGIFNPGNIDKAINDAVAISIPTHNTSIAISGATSIAAAIAESFKSDSKIDDVIDKAIYGAEKGLEFGFPYPGASIARRIELGIDLISGIEDTDKAALKLYDYIGVDMFPHEVVPFVISLFSISKKDKMKVILSAVNIGGDSDTIAALLGALIGAFYGYKYLPNKMREKIEKVNKIDLDFYSRNICNLNLK